MASQEREPSDPASADELEASALEAASLGRLGQAIALLRQAIEIRADEPSYHSNLGSILYIAGDLPGAVAAHRRAIELGSQRMAWYHYNLGVALDASGQLALAQDAYRAALDHDPRMLEAHINLGTLLQRQGQLEAAERAYRQALALAPDHVSALRNLGSVLAASQRMDQADQAYRQALAAAPDDPGTLLDLGALCHARGDLEGALHAYRRAASLRPDAAQVHVRQGLVECALGRPEDALLAYEHALELAPDDIAAHNAKGAALATLTRYDQAISVFERALELDTRAHPDVARPHYNLGVVLHRAGHLRRAVNAYRAALARTPETAPERAITLGNLADCLVRSRHYSEAEAAYRELLAMRPDDATARHLLDALTGVTSQNPPPGYVAQVFDDYAPRFDQHLVHDLGYRAPAELVAELERITAERAMPGPRHVLDLGCGTGLVAEHLSERIPTIEIVHGVDLSAAMLARAQEKHLYHALYQRDLLDFLADTAAGQPYYDLVTSADVFIYLGGLEPVFSAVYARLSPGGLWAFTIEEESGSQPMVLRPTGRYGHSRAYIESLCQAHGLDICQARSLALRKENERTQAGVLYLLQRPEDP